MLIQIVRDSRKKRHIISASGIVLSFFLFSGAKDFPSPLFLVTLSPIPHNWLQNHIVTFSQSWNFHATPGIPKPEISVYTLVGLLKVKREIYHFLKQPSWIDPEEKSPIVSPDYEVPAELLIGAHRRRKILFVNVKVIVCKCISICFVTLQNLFFTLCTHYLTLKIKNKIQIVNILNLNYRMWSRIDYKLHASILLRK